MKSVRHPSNTHVYQAPRDWPTEEGAPTCDALGVTETAMSGLPALVSYWQPSDAERAAIAAGANVELWVVGGNLPPVALAVEGVPE